MYACVYITVRMRKHVCVCVCVYTRVVVNIVFSRSFPLLHTVCVILELGNPSMCVRGLCVFVGFYQAHIKFMCRSGLFKNEANLTAPLG